MITSSRRCCFCAVTRVALDPGRRRNALAQQVVPRLVDSSTTQPRCSASQSRWRPISLILDAERSVLTTSMHSQLSSEPRRGVIRSTAALFGGRLSGCRRPRPHRLQGNWRRHRQARRGQRCLAFCIGPVGIEPTASSAIMGLSKSGCGPCAASSQWLQRRSSCVVTRLCATSAVVSTVSSSPFQSGCSSLGHGPGWRKQSDIEPIGLGLTVNQPLPEALAPLPPRSDAREPNLMFNRPFRIGPRGAEVSALFGYTACCARTQQVQAQPDGRSKNLMPWCSMSRLGRTATSGSTRTRATRSHIRIASRLGIQMDAASLAAHQGTGPLEDNPIRFVVRCDARVAAMITGEISVASTAGHGPWSTGADTTHTRQPNPRSAASITAQLQLLVASRCRQGSRAARPSASTDAA